MANECGRVKAECGCGCGEAACGYGRARVAYDPLLSLQASRQVAGQGNQGVLSWVGREGREGYHPLPVPLLRPADPLLQVEMVVVVSLVVVVVAAAAATAVASQQGWHRVAEVSGRSQDPWACAVADPVA